MANITRRLCILLLLLIAACVTKAAPASAAAAACLKGQQQTCAVPAEAEARPSSEDDAPPAAAFHVGRYSDDVHGAEARDAIRLSADGYKYRELPDGLVLPPYVTPSRLAASQIVPTRPNDVCYCSFPKSGSTWLATVLYLLLHNGSEPLDGSPVRSHLHWVESAWTFPRSLEELEALPSPRIFKSHMPAGYALGGGPARAPCRFIYIARNPKDVVASYFFFERGSAWSGNFNGTWETWLEMFLAGRVQRGSWFDHVLGWWQLREHENMLFLSYEELLRDFPGQLARLARHVGADLTPGLASAIHNATRFDTMRRNPFSNQEHVEDFHGFLRKGKVGSWRDRFTVAQSEAFDQVYQVRMAGSGLEFEFE